MKLRLSFALLSVLVVGALFAPGAQAQMVALIDYVGFGWEDGGVPPSNPGDVFAITATATQLSSLFGIDLVGEEVTVYIYDLVSTGGIPNVPAPGFTTINYVGGMIEVYEDPSMDHTWGVFPPDPANDIPTFTNGTLLFQGAFNNFVLFLDSNGAGGFEGTVDGIATTVAELCLDPVDCAYTFGGAFGPDVGAQLPPGTDYDLQIDGTLEVDAAIPTEVSSFGAVKALFQN
jgi:hypothetical protein